MIFELTLLSPTPHYDFSPGKSIPGGVERWQSVCVSGYCLWRYPECMCMCVCVCMCDLLLVLKSYTNHCKFLDQVTVSVSDAGGCIACVLEVGGGGVGGLDVGVWGVGGE